MVVKKTDSTKASAANVAKKPSLKCPDMKVFKKLSRIELPNIATLRKYSKPITYCGLAFLVGFGTKALLSSNLDVAVVDVQKVINSSSDVISLRQRAQQRTQKLEKWLVSVREDVNKQKTQKEKDKLTQKYNTEFAQKRQIIRRENAAEMQKIGIKIKELISKTAKSGGFDIIFPKNSILDGGVDITDRVLKSMK